MCSPGSPRVCAFHLNDEAAPWPKIRQLCNIFNVLDLAFSSNSLLQMHGHPQWSNSPVISRKAPMNYDVSVETVVNPFV